MWCDIVLFWDICVIWIQTTIILVDSLGNSSRIRSCPCSNMSASKFRSGDLELQSVDLEFQSGDSKHFWNQKLEKCVGFPSRRVCPTFPWDHTFAFVYVHGNALIDILCTSCILYDCISSRRGLLWCVAKALIFVAHSLLRGLPQLRNGEEVKWWIGHGWLLLAPSGCFNCHAASPFQI